MICNDMYPGGRYEEMIHALALRRHKDLKVPDDLR